MITLHRRREDKERHGASWTEIALAYNAGFWTAALLSLFLVTLWRCA